MRSVVVVVMTSSKRRGGRACATDGLQISAGSLKVQPESCTFHAPHGSNDLGVRPGTSPRVVLTAFSGLGSAETAAAPHARAGSAAAGAQAGFDIRADGKVSRRARSACCRIHG